jgi:hypothetical protein
MNLRISFVPRPRTSQDRLAGFEHVLESGRAAAIPVFAGVAVDAQQHNVGIFLAAGHAISFAPEFVFAKRAARIAFRWDVTKFGLSQMLRDSRGFGSFTRMNLSRAIGFSFCVIFDQSDCRAAFAQLCWSMCAASPQNN